MKQIKTRSYPLLVKKMKDPLTKGEEQVEDRRRIRADDRMADVVYYNERLLLVIERFGITLGFGDKTVEEVCQCHGLETSLVLKVINIFANPSTDDGEELTENMVPALLSYLKRGHRYYLDEKLPYINELLNRFIEHTDNPDTKLLLFFFKGYAREVHEHMQLEDSLVFPYIQALYDFVKGEKIQEGQLDYSIDDFVEHHSDIEEKLEDLAQLLIKHFPPTRDRFYRNIILIELFGLHYDLNDHGRIEEHILVPLVRELETKKVKNGQ